MVDSGFLLGLCLESREKGREHVQPFPPYDAGLAFVSEDDTLLPSGLCLSTNLGPHLLLQALVLTSQCQN